MSFWDRLFGKAVDRPAPVQSVARQPSVVRLKMRDWCGMSVAGTYYRQETLIRLFGRYTRTGVELHGEGTFARDRHNEHDANAVAVRISDQVVGYLPAADAARFVAWMSTNLIADDAIFPCKVYVRGGMRTSQHNEEPFRVSINYAWPPKLIDGGDTI